MYKLCKKKELLRYVRVFLLFNFLVVSHKLKKLEVIHK